MESLLSLFAIGKQESIIEVDLSSMLERAYEKFCAGEINREELLKAMEAISLFSFSHYLLTKIERTKTDGRLQENSSAI